MNISTLQSLIDRTSNLITIFEAGLADHKVLAKISSLKVEREWRKKESGLWGKYLNELRKIQKELKREIAKEIEKARLQRFYDSM